jgi:CBS domain-containing protein
MRVADLMQPDVKTIDPDATIADAVVSLADAHISGLPVVDRGGRMLGVVSTSDVIAVEAEAEERGRAELLRGTAVRDIMTPRTLTISPEADIREAARQMLYAEVHRLFVASDGELLGVISTTDIVRALATGKV